MVAHLSTHLPSKQKKPGRHLKNLQGSTGAISFTQNPFIQLNPGLHFIFSQSCLTGSLMHAPYLQIKSLAHFTKTHGLLAQSKTHYPSLQTHPGEHNFLHY